MRIYPNLVINATKFWVKKTNHDKFFYKKILLCKPLNNNNFASIMAFNLTSLINVRNIYFFEPVKRKISIGLMYHERKTKDVKILLTTNN